MSRQALTESVNKSQLKLLEALHRLAAYETKLELAKARNRLRIVEEQRGTYREAARRYQATIVELQQKLKEKNNG